jgi:hypothetical protein
MKELQNDFIGLWKNPQKVICFVLRVINQNKIQPEHFVLPFLKGKTTDSLYQLISVKKNSEILRGDLSLLAKVKPSLYP